MVYALETRHTNTIPNMMVCKTTDGSRNRIKNMGWISTTMNFQGCFDRTSSLNTLPETNSKLAPEN